MTPTQDKPPFDPLAEKAANYDRLLATLARSGLCEDMVLVGATAVDVIAIHDRALATAWFENAPVYGEGE